jgi:PPOX class probable F420-dependent enzyme
MSAFAPVWDAFPQALLDFWTERHLLTLTTIRPDGRPHLVPVGVALDLDEECAWVITSRDSRKVRNLREGDARVAACQVDGRRWSTIEGSAVVLDDPASVARAEDRYARRYKQPRPNPQRVALRITVDRFLHSSTL